MDLPFFIHSFTSLTIFWATSLFLLNEGDNDMQNALTNYSAATLKIYINQGFNMTGANYAKTALNGLITQLSNQYSNNFIALIPANASAPTLMAVPAWVGALIGGFIVYLATSNIYKIVRSIPFRNRI